MENNGDSVSSSLLERLIYYRDIIEVEDEDAESVERCIALINLKGEDNLTHEDREIIKATILRVEEDIKEGELISQFLNRVRENGIKPLSGEAEFEKIKMLLEVSDIESFRRLREDLDLSDLLLEFGRRKKMEEKREKERGNVKSEKTADEEKT